MGITALALAETRRTRKKATPKHRRDFSALLSFQEISACSPRTFS